MYKYQYIIYINLNIITFLKFLIICLSQLAVILSHFRSRSIVLLADIICFLGTNKHFVITISHSNEIIKCRHVFKISIESIENVLTHGMGRGKSKPNILPLYISITA